MESDRQSDIIPFVGRGNVQPSSLLAEDIFVQVGAAKAFAETGSLLSQLADAQALEQGLSVWVGARQPLQRSMTYRVIARVQDERHFLRTELRRACEEHLHRLRPRWRLGDPAQLEFWILETEVGFFRLGLRLSSPAMRHHGGRRTERRGALRPTVAAAMVKMAGRPGRLLDPCCGSGTILSEGLAVGWQVVGSDIDAHALAVAKVNVPQAEAILQADARQLDWPDASFDAVVSNLPFGRQFKVSDEWHESVFREIGRITKQGGSAVFLSPVGTISNAAALARLRLVETHPLILLGTQTAISCYGREP